MASTAAEGELSVERLRATRITQVFCRMHMAYLAEELRGQGDKLRKAKPPQGLEYSLRECQRQRELLLDQLNRLPAIFDDPAALAAAQRNFGRIRQDCLQARARL